MPNGKIDKDDLRRILALYEMAEHAAQEGADTHTVHEASNAFAALIKLLSKYGLTIGDIPELRNRHEQEQAKTSAKTTNATTDQSNVLQLIEHMLRSYSDIQSHEYTASALWICFTHVFSHFEINPRLALLSPVPGCGKSNTLTLIGKLAANAERHDHITPAALFRLIDNAAPTLILDEGENSGLRINADLRAVLDSGYQKGGVITRTIRGEARSFSTFAPIAIGAIGSLTLPLMQRSVVIQMHNAERTDLKTREDMASPREIARFNGLHRLIASWAQSVIQFDHSPPLPKILRGRVADNWRILVSVADSFGSAHWSEAARAAAIAFADGFFDENAAICLLYDIRTIFRRHDIDRIKSAVLIEKLRELDDGMGIWDAWRGENDDRSPHPITAGEIATMLRRFDRNLRPQTMFNLGSRAERGTAGRGYYRSQFERWWTRYCKADTDASADNVVRQLHPKSN
jgi:hypothetical protein